MKVKDLISKLQKCNPESDVRIGSQFGESVFMVCSHSRNENVISIETPQTDFENGLKDFLVYTFNSLDVTTTDELDFYTYLTSMGVTSEMVRKYVGGSYARAFDRFCSKHGLI